jgi:hypothetical protein
MSDYLGKISDMQGGLEELVRKIPGFKGYFAREDRREADQLLREHLVRVFEELHGKLTQYERRLIDAGGIMHMERVQSVDTKMRTFIDRIKTAAHGYAGLFDAVKVGEDELAKLYAFDNALLDYEGRFSAAIERFGETIGTDELGTVISEMDDLVTEANNTFKRRVEVIQSMAAV